MTSAVGQMPRDAAFGAGGQQVADADVGERAAGHHAVVAAPRAVAVEVGRLRRPAPADTCPAGLSAAIEPAGEMWSVVTESPKAASTRAPRIGWIGPGSAARSTRNGGSWMYVLAASHGNNSLSARRGSRSTSSLRLEHVGVAVAEHLGPDRLRDRGRDFLAASARCPAGRPAGRRCPCPAARASDRCRPCRPGHRPRPAAGWPGSWPSPAD